MIKISIKKGSIITEVLVTMVIIIITMVSIVPMFFTGLKASKTSKAKSININIIQKEIENLSQQKFSKIITDIQPLIISGDLTPPIGDDFDRFLKDNSDANKLKDFEVSNTCVYINKTTGDYQNLYPICDVSKINTLVSKGYSQYQMKYIYSYSKGSNSTDDALQITVELRPYGGDSKPVSMTTILTKDKL